MQHRSRLWAALTIAGTISLASCADPGAVAPVPAPSGASASEVATADDAPPDSAELFVYPSDGPGPDETSGSEVGSDDGTMAAQSVAAAAAPAPRIRVGVIQVATRVTLGSAAGYTVRDKGTNLVLFSGTDGGAVTVSLLQVATSHFRLQVMCGSTSAVATRKAAAEALGHATLTEFVAGSNCTRLFLGEFAPPPANTFAARTTYRNTLIQQGLAGTDSFWRVVTLPGGVVYRVERGAEAKTSVNPVVLQSSDGIVTIGGVDGATTIPTRRYRGVAEARQSQAALAGINELPLEEYLYGVVPRELGPVAYPELEAQKAQAVAARTYGLEGIRTNKRGSDGYHLRATTDDQVYGGYADEHPVSSAAVDATAGVVATFEGRLISALFSSTSGGHTSDNEEAFAAAPAAYLRGVPDAERGEALAHVPTLEVFRAHANPASLRAAREGDFESDWARYHRWTFEWTMAEMSAVISAYARQPVGRVLAVNVLERGPSGRVLRIEYVTEAGTFTDTRDRIRSSLRYINASGTPANLLSTLFFVEPLRDPATKEPTGYRVYGGGFGHGVGLSQTGAVGMAQKGHTFEQILRHYYRGIAVAAEY
ncbi:MAG: SpoIID [uncultured Gemmatimonadaceae bacterium]|uniref:SpoIID n=1 Tax=uncultured Gemmatimonadaceae bacterium TaxID=246130 RepID=A0A6J4LKG9_9BACT|nr:MAG: SpoIID [uncultured Gemmatimonadaceae bacterium]